ncbi:MAG TPA: isoleucine--tRNA ligase, partial [Bacillota bacterium]
MRANLPAREPEFLRRWNELDLYRRLREERRGGEKFILHDGPPYANGEIHIGTALNKVLKDFIIRYKSLRGFDAPYVPGWDTHGLPIEMRALEELGIDRHAVEPLELRRACRDFALKWKDVQREQFQRLGVLGDWDHPYLTLTPDYEAVQVRVFGEMARKGYIYKDLYPVYWCPVCETALAEAEVEFHDKESPSIYVAFPVHDGRGLLPEGAEIVIWTTTPWTLPANLAIALHPDETYALLDSDRGAVLLAEKLVEAVAKATGLVVHGVRARFSGRQLEGVRCRHPWADRDSLVILGEHVTVEDGTGAVHTAPGHGQEDFDVGRRYGLDVLQPLDDRGRFGPEAAPFTGLFYEDANEPIIDLLRQRGRLLGASRITHPYAHCWRSKNPVIWRATEQWFASVEGFRQAALEAIDRVRWIPAWGRDRIRNMVAARSDWCISRQRVWGVPIPVFYCEGCGEVLLNDGTIAAVAELFSREGSDAWWRYSAEQILPAGTTCPACGHHGFRKETDIMDVWFDSGSSHAAVLPGHPDLRWPADLYLEGSDQHRGWFQSSLLTAVATRGSAPYREVLTHGFVVDGEGRKMSKSLGNTVAPQDIVRQYGADVLRLWVASSDYRGDVRISPDIVRQLAEVYRKIRNTLRFLLANLYDFDPERDVVAYERLGDLDRWLLRRLAQVVDRVGRAYDDYQYHLVYQAVHGLCVVDLSAFYLDVNKDRLYAEAAAALSRRSVQTVLYHTAHVLVRLLAPMLPFTAEDVWQHLPKPASAPPSVHLCSWPEVPAAWLAPELEQPWQILLAVREEVARAVENARQTTVLSDPAAARVRVVTADAGWLEVLRHYEDELPLYFRVAEVIVDAGQVEGAEAPVAVTVERTDQQK